MEVDTSVGMCVRPVPTATTERVPEWVDYEALRRGGRRDVLMSELQKSTQLDKETGLPALPEGYYWKVVPYGGHTLIIRLMRVRKYWLDAELGWESTFNSEGKRGLLRAAWEVLSAIREKETTASLAGKYPPKRLHD